jgi:membrane associated rhomboid family serine protease/ribosomal protein L37AE/L43A
MNCPKDKQAMKLLRDGHYCCELCRSHLIIDDVLRVEIPGSLARLSDTATQSAMHCCPECAEPMRAQQLGQGAAIVYKCTECSWLFIASQAFSNLQHQSEIAARQVAYAALPEHVKQEFKDLLVADREYPTDIPKVQRVLAMAGFPVVKGFARQRLSFLTMALAILTIGGFWFFGHDDNSLAAAGLQSDNITIVALLRHLFVHADAWHLIGNLFFLAAFGDLIEQHCERWQWLAGYLAVGLVAALAQVWITDDPVVLVGASGAISGLIGMAVSLAPKARVVTGVPGFSIVFPLIIEVSITTFAVVTLLFQFVKSTISSDNVAWYAHIAGLIAGVACGAAFRALQK